MHETSKKFWLCYTAFQRWTVLERSNVQQIQEREVPMKRKAAIFRGLAAIMAFLLFITVSGSNLMFTYAGVINSVFNISTSRTIETGDGSAELFYYDTRYGTDINDPQAALQVEMAVAAENIATTEEGVVLLQNENNALPLAQGSRVTIFGNGSYNSMRPSTSTAFDSIPAVSFISAMQTALGTDNVNTTLADNVYSGLLATTATVVTEAPVSDVIAYEGTWQNDYNDAAIVMLSRSGSEGSDSTFYTDEGRRYADAIMAAVEAGNGQLLESLRLSAKHNIYAISRTIAQNGLSSDSVVVSIVPLWETALLVATLVFAVGFVGFTAASAVTASRQKKEA